MRLSDSLKVTGNPVLNLSLPAEIKKAAGQGIADVCKRIKKCNRFGSSFHSNISWKKGFYMIWLKRE